MLTSLRHLFGLFDSRDHWRFALIVVLMIGATGMELVGIGVVPLFIGLVLNPEWVQQHPQLADCLGRCGISVGSRNQLLLGGGLALLLVFVLRTAYLIFNHWLQDRIIRNRQIELVHRLYTAYLSAPYSFHLQRNSADLINNVTRLGETVISEVANPFLILCRHSVVVTAIIAFLLWRQALVVCVSVPLLGGAGLAFILLSQHWIKKLGNQEYSGRQAALKLVSEGFSILKEVKVANCEAAFIKSHHGEAERIAEAQRYRGSIHKSTWPIMELAGMVGLLGIAAFMILRGGTVEKIAPDLALFGIAFVRLKSCGTDLITSCSQIRYHLPAVEPLYQDLQRLSGDTSALAAVERLPLRETLEIHNLSYTYPESETAVLQGIDLTVKRGQSVAFVGSTGAGKTTLIDIVIGLLPPGEGKVCIDGKDLRGLERRWQRSIGYVPQDFTLLDATIRANIALGVAEDQIDEERLAHCLELTQLKDVIAALPEGTYTNVGERGIRLSGGQRQRIGIARALYRDPEILIFDEGTSALDENTEARLIRALEGIRREYTVLTISHRLATIRNHDCIFVLENGRLAASGTYGELLATSPAFRRIANETTTNSSTNSKP